MATALVGQTISSVPPVSDGRQEWATTSPALPEAPEAPGFGPILVRSIAVASLVMFVAVGVAMWSISGGVWDGIGLGLFCAFWGGPGFGLMAAGASWTHKMERHRAAS